VRYQMYISLRVEYLLFLPDFNELDFFRQILRTTQILSVVKVHTLEAGLFRADGQTDGSHVTKIIVPFRSFAKAPKVVLMQHVYAEPVGLMAFC
jgi:hypothetical protein